jgi:hypothetical protein
MQEIITKVVSSDIAIINLNLFTFISAHIIILSYQLTLYVSSSAVDRTSSNNLTSIPKKVKFEALFNTLKPYCSEFQLSFPSQGLLSSLADIVA